MSKRILFLTPQLPYPPHQGTALRNFGLIKGLAQRGHSLALLSFVDEGQPPYTETPLADLCSPVISLPAPTRSMRQRLFDLLVGRVDLARRLWSPQMLETLRGLLARERFDAIHFEGIEMAAYLRPVWHDILREAPDTLLIYDAHNAEHALQRRIARQDVRNPRRLPQAFYSFIQANRLERFESLVCLTADHVFACSHADARLLAALRQPTLVSVVPNAIDMSGYERSAWAPVGLPHPALVFTGKMDFRPNVDAALWFANKVLPRIHDQVPEAHFVIVGKKPHPRLDVLRGRPGVMITGEVPQVQPYLAAADVYVAPLRMGSGTRLKLLEAMAMGCAIVSTHMGAEGLNVRSGEHLLLADLPTGFAREVVSLLHDEGQRAMLGTAAAHLVRQQFDWPAIIPRVEAAYAAVG